MASAKEPAVPVITSPAKRSELDLEIDRLWHLERQTSNEALRADYLRRRRALEDQRAKFTVGAEPRFP